MKTGTISSMGMVLVLLMLLALATPIAAAVGRDVLSVGPGREYETIQAAVDAANEGSHILVYPRIGQDPERYEESVTVTTNNLQIVAQGKNVIVSPPEGQPGFDVKADHVTVQGFEISGAACAPGITFQGSFNAFADNLIHFFQGPCSPTAIQCADTDGGSDYNTIDNNIADNKVEICGMDCLALKAGKGATLSRNEVVGNTIAQSFARGVSLSAGQNAQVNDNLFLRNLVYRSMTDGIALSAGSDQNRILNNQVQTNHDVGVAVAGDDNLIAHNWIWNNGTDTQDTGQDNEWQNNVVGQPYGPRLYLPFAASVVSVSLRDSGWAIGSRVDGVPVIVHTADGGLSWQAQGDLTAWKGASANDISAVDHVTAWAALGSTDEAAGGAILHTTDGGTTWTSQPIPPDLEGGVKSIKGLSRKVAWAASLRGTILHTTDGGATWNVVPHPGLPIYQVNRMDAKGKNVWIADAWVKDDKGPLGAVVHTQDGGLSWRAERLPDDSPLTVHAFSTEAVWASGSWLAKNPAFYRTLDGGDEWEHIITLGGDDHLDDICAASRDDVWGVTNQGNIWRIHVAPDGTPEKHLITPLKELGRHMPEGITCLDASTAWAVAMGIPGTTDELGVILHTTDGGKKWVKQPAPTDVQYWKVSFASAKR